MRMSCSRTRTVTVDFPADASIRRSAAAGLGAAVVATAAVGDGAALVAAGVGAAVLPQAQAARRTASDRSNIVGIPFCVMLIREDLGTELARVTRILSYAGALAPDARITALAGEVVYVAARGVANAAMTAHDIAIVRLVDADALRGEPPPEIERYLAVYRQRPLAKAVALASDGSLVNGLTLLACAKATLLRADPEASWERAEAEARAGGALLGLATD